MSPKKYRPPRPMDVKGGCSPQNILESAELLTELAHGCNRFLNDPTRFFSWAAINCSYETGAALSNHLPLRGAGRVFAPRRPPLSAERSLQPGAPSRFFDDAESD